MTKNEVLHLSQRTRSTQRHLLYMNECINVYVCMYIYSEKASTISYLGESPNPDLSNLACIDVECTYKADSIIKTDKQDRY